MTKKKIPSQKPAQFKEETRGYAGLVLFLLATAAVSAFGLWQALRTH